MKRIIWVTLWTSRVPKVQLLLPPAGGTPTSPPCLSAPPAHRGVRLRTATRISILPFSHVTEGKTRLRWKARQLVVVGGGHDTRLCWERRGGLTEGGGLTRAGELGAERHVAFIWTFNHHLGSEKNAWEMLCRSYGHYHVMFTFGCGLAAPH